MMSKEDGQTKKADILIQMVSKKIKKFNNRINKMSQEKMINKLLTNSKKCLWKRSKEQFTKSLIIKKLKPQKKTIHNQDNLTFKKKPSNFYRNIIKNNKREKDYQHKFLYISK